MKLYRPPLPSTYKETELSYDLNGDLEWVFRDYGKSLNQEKEPLPPRDNVADFNLNTGANEFEKNLKLHGCPSYLREKFKEAVTYY